MDFMAVLMLAANCKARVPNPCSFAQSCFGGRVAGVAESERLSAWWAFVTFTFPVSDSVGDDARLT